MASLLASPRLWVNSAAACYDPPCKQGISGGKVLNLFRTRWIREPCRPVDRRRGIPGLELIVRFPRIAPRQRTTESGLYSSAQRPQLPYDRTAALLESGHFAARCARLHWVVSGHVHVGPLHKPSSLSARRTLSRSMWTYVACWQHKALLRPTKAASLIRTAMHSDSRIPKVIHLAYANRSVLR